MNRSIRQLVLALLVSLVLAKPSQADNGNNNPTGPAGDYNGSITTGGSYDPLTGNASRVVEDIAVVGSVGAYPLKWTRTLSTRGLSPTHFGQGGTWSHPYDWNMATYPPPSPSATPQPERADGYVAYPDGRRVDVYEPWTAGGCRVDGANGPFGIDDWLVDVSPAGTPRQYYDLHLADGGVVKFTWQQYSDGGVMRWSPLAHEIIDPYGQSTVLGRDSDGKLITVTEPAGRLLQIHYQQYGGQFWLIDYVQAYAAPGQLTQTVTYGYDPMTSSAGTRYYLKRVTYDDGNVATYTYGTGTAGGVPFGVIEGCNDFRYAGAMSRIRYEYLRYEDIGHNPGVGQIKKEKNVNGDLVSAVTFPQWNCNSGGGGNPECGRRTETRPDGSTRTFEYAGAGGWINWRTDFENHASTIDAHIDGPHAGTIEFKDARENSTYVTFNDLGAVRMVFHPDNSWTTTEYWDDNRPYFVRYHTDENGKITEYLRDGNNRVQRINYPDFPVNGFEEFTYTSLGQIETHTMTSGGIENFRYDNRGLKTDSWPPETPSDSDPYSHRTRYFYYGGWSGPGNGPEAPERPDLIDRLRRIIDPRGNSTWFEYNQRGQVTRVTHADGASTQNEYNADGTLHWTTDELGHTTTYTYDEYKRVTELKNHLNETVTNNYAPWNGAGPLSHTSSSVYQTLQMLERTDYDYDHNFRRTATIQAPNSTDDAATTTSTYDAVGNLETVTEPNGQATGAHTTFGYDSRNRQISVTNALGEITSTEYDPAGNKTKETRQDQTLRSWDYDSMNRLWHAYDWRTNPTPTANQTTTYVRDAAGNALSITDTKGAVYRYEYDPLNRKRSATYPHDATVPERTEAWFYDFAGNAKIHKNPADQYQHFEYDERNRQRRSYWNLSDSDTAAANWSVGPETATTLDDASRMTEIKTNNGETIVALGYDDANRKLWEDQTVGVQPTRRVKTDFDTDGRRTALQIVDPPTEGGDMIISPEMSGSGSYSITYQYTHRNQLKRIQGEAGEDWAFNYSYDKSGNMTTREAVSGSGASSSTSCPEYDALNRPKIWEQTGTAGTFGRSHYQYDQVNREEATWREEECYLGDCNLGERFTYEPTNQLASAKYNAKNAWVAPQNAELSVDYAYPSNNLNRSTMTVTPRSGPVVATNYSPNALNQYTGVAGMSYSYDNNFNLAATGAFFGVYDAANHLVSASNSGGDAPAVVAQFVYDGLGRCVKRALNGVETVFLYDGWKPIAEWYAAKPDYFQAWNVYGPGADEILLRQQGDIGYVRFHSDPHGNVAFLVWNNGTVLEKCSYDAFGKATVRDAGGGRPRSWSYYAHGFLFQGREYIKELGIYDYRHRFYHPETGRFLQTDPTGFDAGDMNLFRYCGDDPIDRSDPTGLDSDITLERDYADPHHIAPGNYKIEDHGHVYRFRANENPFFKGKTGIKPGDYVLKPKGTSWGMPVKGRDFPVDQPAITGSASGLKPGQPNKSYLQPALVHGAGRPGYPDSAGCVTVSPQAEQLTKDITNRNNSKNEVTNFHIRERNVTDIQRAQSTVQAPRTSDLGSASSGSTEHSQLTAAGVDFLHQGTGVPSLGAEAVNFVPGPR